MECKLFHKCPDARAQLEEVIGLGKENMRQETRVSSVKLSATRLPQLNVFTTLCAIMPCSMLSASSPGKSHA